MAVGELLYEAFMPIGSPTAPVEVTTIASAATIAPAGYITVVTGTTSVATITLPYTGFSGTICLIFDNAGPGATLTTGNIAKATTVIQNQALFMTWSPSKAKWFPSYV